MLNVMGGIHSVKVASKTFKSLEPLVFTKFWSCRWKFWESTREVVFLDWLIQFSAWLINSLTFWLIDWFSLTFQTGSSFAMAYYQFGSLFENVTTIFDLIRMFCSYHTNVQIINIHIFKATIKKCGNCLHPLSSPSTILLCIKVS